MSAIINLKKSKMLKCPYCGRDIIESERYCFFCDQDLSKIVNKAEKPDAQFNPPNFKGDFEKLKKGLGKLQKRIKKIVKRKN